MIRSVKDAVLSAISFLNNSQFPPNAVPEDVERLKSINHMESKKFFALMVSVLILSVFYFASVAILFFLPPIPEINTGFVTIFSKTTEILAIVVASYVGAQAAVDLKFGSSSAATVNGNTQTINQTIEQTTTQTTTENINEITIIHSNVKEDDYELK